jgi:hypothetical protein
MRCRKERRTREPLAEYVNWTTWSRKDVKSTTEMSIHERTNVQKEPKVPHEINKWWADSASPQPEMHNELQKIRCLDWSGLLLWATCHTIDATERWPSTELDGTKWVVMCNSWKPKHEKSKDDMFLWQCSLCRGRAATVTYLKTEPTIKR